MAKAKATQRWVARESKAEGGWYMLFIGPKPRKRKGQWISDSEGFAGFVCSSNYKQFCPDDLHLRYSGGPVEIRFAKVVKVKHVAKK